MATTTNYGWTTPDDTALVKDGAAAIRTLGSSVDTTTKALNPGTTNGDLDYYSTGTTKTRLAIGTNGQVLTSNGTVPTWASPAAGGGLTLLSTTTLSGASTTISSISQSYKYLMAVFNGIYTSAGDDIEMRVGINGTATGSQESVLLVLRDTTYSAVANTSTGNYLQFGYGTNGNVGTQPANGTFSIYNYTTANVKFLSGVSRMRNNTSSTRVTSYCTGQYTGSAAITSLVFTLASGNFSGGTVLLYGAN
jgi:hypothetical protein